MMQPCTVARYHYSSVWRLFSLYLRCPVHIGFYYGGGVANGVFFLAEPLPKSRFSPSMLGLRPLTLYEEFFPMFNSQKMCVRFDITVDHSRLKSYIVSVGVVLSYVCELNVTTSLLP